MSDGFAIVLCTLTGSLTTAVLFSALHGVGVATAIGFVVAGVVCVVGGLR